MPGFDPPTEVCERKILAVLCLVLAAACFVGLLFIALRGDPTAAWKFGQSTWVPKFDGRAR